MEPEQTGKLVERNNIVNVNGTLALQVFWLDLIERGLTRTNRKHSSAMM
jgi:hypothetical protein